MEKEINLKLKRISGYFLRNKNLILLSIFLVAYLLYLPSLFSFYTNDDFYNLKIAQVHSIFDFLNFFNLFHSNIGFGLYRPLTTQVFFALAWMFKLNPLVLHLISFTVLFLDIFLVYKLVFIFTKNYKAALIGAFLFGTSSIHFGHMYYLSTFQELGLAAFYFGTVLFFITFIKSFKKKWYFYAVATFVGSLLCKESAVTLPFILLLVYWYFWSKKEIEVKFNALIWYVIPFFMILFIYLFLHLFFYGFAKGDSYIWSVSPRILNTLVWYALWSLNLPEMLVDYIGPGVKLNPNLFNFYGNFIYPILGLFIPLISMLFYMLYKNIFLNSVKKITILSVAFFLLTITPVVFLPFHKFSYELTVPILGIVLFISFYLSKIKSIFFVTIFLVIFLSLSVVTNILSFKTSWITQGASASYKTYKSINSFILNGNNYNKVMFYDTLDNKSLPWKPSDQIKNVLSGSNFFYDFYPCVLDPVYGYSAVYDMNTTVKLKASDLLYY